MRYRNLTLIGTSHIARQSVNQVREAIKNISPSVVAVELDKSRYHSLKDTSRSRIKMRDILDVGIVGFLFAVLGRWAQKKMGRLVGIMPGEEMLTAVREARKSGAGIRFIDQDMGITLRKLSKAITWREKARFFTDIIKSIIFRKREMKRLGIETLDLTKVPERKLIRKLTKEMKKNYPNAYRVLVDERNHVMAERLAHIMDENPDSEIVAVIGAGHEEEMLGLVKESLNREDITYSFSVSP